MDLHVKISHAAWDKFEQYKQHMTEYTSKIQRQEDKLQVMFTLGFTHGWLAGLKDAGLIAPRSNQEITH